MARLYFVRHGKAASGFGESLDPGLDETGREQAEAVAQKLKSIGPLPILSSPLARTQQTANPLAKLWGATVDIEEAVAEVPSPDGVTLEGRATWLRKLMGGSWRDVNPELASWREHCITTVTAIAQDTVIFSHYVAINVIMGAAMDDDRFVVFSPDNCSVTIFETDGTTLRLIEKGHEAVTKVN